MATEQANSFFLPGGILDDEDDDEARMIPHSSTTGSIRPPPGFGSTSTGLPFCYSRTGIELDSSNATSRSGERIFSSSSPPSVLRPTTPIGSGRSSLQQSSSSWYSKTNTSVIGGVATGEPNSSRESDVVGYV